MHRQHKTLDTSIIDFVIMSIMLATVEWKKCRASSLNDRKFLCGRERAHMFKPFNMMMELWMSNKAASNWKEK